MPRGRRRTTTKKKGKQAGDMDSSQSYTAESSQSESWDCPPSKKKHLIQDSPVISKIRSSLRLAKKNIESTTSVQDNQVPDFTVVHARCASLRSAKKFTETRTTFVQAYQLPQCSVAEPESLPRQVVHPCTFAPEIRHEEIEKVGDFVAPENWLVDVAEMAGRSEAENPMVLLELKPLDAEGIQESSNSRERADKNNSKSISMVGHTSSHFSLNITEMVNMWANDGDEVNFFGVSSPKDTVEGYQVKPKFIPMLRKILSKHGDIFENSMVSTMTFRSMFFEVIGDILSELEDKGLIKIRDDELHNMIVNANEMKNMKVNIEWLHLRLEEILEAKQILKQSGTLKEEKDRNRKAMESAKKELECCEVEKKALEAKFQQLLDRIYDKETSCKETLARTQDESARIAQTIRNAKSKVGRFVNCSLVDGLL